MELPRLEPLWARYRDRNFTVIAVESERDTEAAREFITENGLTYPMVEDVEGDGNVLAERLQVYGFPTSFLVDREGRIMYTHLGFDEGDEIRLEEEIVRLLDS